MNLQLGNSTIHKKCVRPFGASDLKPRKFKKNENLTKNKVDQIQTIENIINPHNINEDLDAKSEGEDDNTNVDNHEISM